jgi:hypothetical protein
MTITLVDGGEVEAGLGWDALTHAPGTAPSAPQALAAANGTVDLTDIVVTWTEPADKGGWSTLEGYEVELSAGGDSSTVQAPSSPVTFLAKPLTTTYDIRARARNLVGWGNWAGPISYLHASFPFASDILGWFTAQDTSHANGTAVDTWTSTFGNKTLTKYSATSAPTKRTNHRNGLAAIEFDGVDDNLKSATPFASQGNYTVVFVGQFGLFESSIGYFDFGGHSISYGNAFGHWNGRFTWRRNNFKYLGPASMSAPTYNNLPFIIILSNESNGYIKSTIRINGTTYVEDTDGTNYGTEIMQNIRLGTDQDSPHRGPQFFVYEFGCYSSSKSLTDRAAILAHFQSKYAIA